MRGGLIAAIGFAALAAIIVLRMSGGTDAPAPTPQQAAQELKTTDIYVAAKPIQVGTVITADMIAVQPWPEHLTMEGFVGSSNPADAIGMVARGAFQQQEPLIKSKLANPSDPNFLAGELPAGMRVVTVPLNEVDGIAGFVFPGDHVDLIFTHDIDKWETPPPAGNAAPIVGERPTRVKVTVSETLLTNVKVLAVDQRASGASATDEKGRLYIPKSASLMVSQSDAQRVRLAQKTGSVSLALRAIADRESSDPLVMTGGQDITLDKQEATGSATQVETVKILRGAPNANKEQESMGSVYRGAPGASGPYTPGSPNVINPGLVAVP